MTPVLANNPWWRPGVRRNRVPLTVLIVAIVASAATIALFHRGTLERDEARFRNAVQSTTDRLEARLDAYTAVLLSTRALFIANRGNVDAGTFGRFVTEQELQRRYPGIQGVGFSRKFTPSQRAEVEESRRRDGAPEFAVWPADPRGELHSILFIEPLDRRNQAALGYDMHTEPIRREAMDRARDTGLPAVSGSVTLVQEIDANKQSGFLLYVPLYEDADVPATVEERRAKLVGFVYAPFRVDDLLAGIFGSEQQHRVTFSLRDGVTGAVMHVPADAPERPHIVTTEALTVGGHPWQLRFESLPALDDSSTRRLLPYVVAGALLVILLLFVLSVLQSRAQEQYRLQSRILDSMTEGVSVSDETGVILYTNPAEDRMFGYARGELIGQPVTVQNTYPAEENQRIVGEVIAQLKQHGVWTGEFSNVKKDGSPFTTSARISALELGGKSYWVCVQEDITVRKVAERERDAALEREHSLRLAAEKASRAKDEFVAMVSHELRNPMAPMTAAVELLRRRGGEAIHKEVDVIDRQLAQLRNVVDDLLDVSSIMRDEIRLTKRPVELATIVRDAVARVASKLEQRQVSIAVDETGLAVEVDPDRMTQVIANVVGNAAKYTDAGGRIEIATEKQGESIVLRVADDGAGMSPEVLQNVFEPFVQGQRRLVLAKGGLGLGLTIVKGLVELHGGSVEARSAGPDRGSELVIRLPSSTREVPAAPEQAQARRPKRILVVDDNPDAADLLAELLQHAGYEVCVAYSPSSALELTKANAVDAAILDIGLPEMDGYELATKLDGATKPVLIALTGYGRDDDRERSRAAGFSHHFVKPISAEHLLDVLGRL